jgi:hypothetical protein
MPSHPVARDRGGTNVEQGERVSNLVAVAYSNEAEQTLQDSLVKGAAAQ